jgi:hypothetical protein
MKKRLPLFIAGWLTLSFATAGSPGAGSAPQSNGTVTAGAVIRNLKLDSNKSNLRFRISDRRWAFVQF